MSDPRDRQDLYRRALGLPEKWLKYEQIRQIAQAFDLPPDLLFGVSANVAWATPGADPVADIRNWAARAGE